MAKDMKGKEKGERGKVCENPSEGRQEAGWESEREREKLKETEVENHLGMDECGWFRWQLERKSLEI